MPVHPKRPVSAGNETRRYRRARPALTYHESGHAIVAIELGYTVTRVSIIPDKTFGLTTIRWPRWLFKEAYRYDPLTASRQWHVHNYITIALAPLWPPAFTQAGARGVFLG
jgi:hypothetical protein